MTTGKKAAKIRIRNNPIQATSMPMSPTDNEIEHHQIAY
jgi:hypothetical protein